MIHKMELCSGNASSPRGKRVFDERCIALCLTDADEYQMTVGKNSDGVYTVKVSKHYRDWEMSVCDFLQFHESRHNSILLSIEQEDLERAQQRYQGHQYRDPFLRENEPAVLIHSTTYENWMSIKKDRCLKSWNVLKREKEAWEERPIGQELGDPLDFRNFIMFSHDSISGELVVLSKQHGRIIMNRDMLYKAGARLYLDSQKLAADGLLIRDGMHLKVLDTCPLEPYLIWCATWENVGLNSRLSTPKEFAEKSDRMFHQYVQSNSIAVF